MKANNYEQTIKQVPNEWGITIPDTISDSCKDYYHVLMIQRTNIPEQERYVTEAFVQQYPKDAWEGRKGNGIKDNLAMLGYKHAYVLHDPKKKVEPKKGGRPKKVVEETTEEN